MANPQSTRRVSVGARFGRLIVVEDLGTTGRPYHFRRWRVKCDCGEERIVLNQSLHRQISCGCEQRRRSADAARTHGMTKSPLYKVWTAMRQRCLNPNCASWPKYGGRGITLCERWKDDYAAFVEDVGQRPEGARWSIDRIDNSRGYEPGNVRWATDVRQARNSRLTRMLTHDGATLPLGDWADRLGMKPGTLRNRLHYGWTVHRALTEPVR
jgi:hypothetical protein